MDYDKLADQLKALADPNRLKILKILSNGGQRACDILYHFEFTQPSLSYHMKNLYEADLVKKSKEGRWIFYTLNDDIIKQLSTELDGIFTLDEENDLYNKIPILEALEGEYKQ